MITKTRGIVIKYLKYRESSIIVHIFTEDFGMVSFIINGIRSPKSKRSIGYFQPFSLLDLVVYMKPNREIQRLSEYKFCLPLHNIQQDIRKSSIALFLTEILGKLLVHEQDDEHRQIFNYLAESVQVLDQMTSEIENFHLHFLLKLMPYLGVGIEDGDSLIHSMELEMTKQDDQLIEFISHILSSPVIQPIRKNSQLRFRTLDLILNYLQHHVTQLGEIRSLKVLHQVFS